MKRIKVQKQVSDSSLIEIVDLDSVEAVYRNGIYLQPNQYEENPSTVYINDLKFGLYEVEYLEAPFIPGVFTNGYWSVKSFIQSGETFASFRNKNGSEVIVKLATFEIPFWEITEGVFQPISVVYNSTNKKIIVVSRCEDVIISGFQKNRFVISVIDAPTGNLDFAYDYHPDQYVLWGDLMSIGLLQAGSNVTLRWVNRHSTSELSSPGVYYRSCIFNFLTQSIVAERNLRLTTTDPGGQSVYLISSNGQKVQIILSNGSLDPRAISLNINDSNATTSNRVDTSNVELSGDILMKVFYAPPYIPGFRPNNLQFQGVNMNFSFWPDLELTRFNTSTDKAYKFSGDINSNTYPRTQIAKRHTGHVISLGWSNASSTVNLIFTQTGDVLFSFPKESWMHPLTNYQGYFLDLMIFDYGDSTKWKYINVLDGTIGEIDKITIPEPSVWLDSTVVISGL